MGNRTAEDGDNRQGEDQQREREHHIDEALEVQVHFATEIRTDDAENSPTGRAAKGGGQADQQRDASAVDDASEQIPAELVGAEPMVQARGGELYALIDCIGIVGGEDMAKMAVSAINRTMAPPAAPRAS